MFLPDASFAIIDILWNVSECCWGVLYFFVVFCALVLQFFGPRKVFFQTYSCANLLLEDI